MGGKTDMHRIAVGVIYVTLLFCLGVTGGQAEKDCKDLSNPAFEVLNGSRANPNITLGELLDSYEKAVGGKEEVEKIRTVVAHEERRGETNPGDWRTGSAMASLNTPHKAQGYLTPP